MTNRLASFSQKMVPFFSQVPCFGDVTFLSLLTILLVFQPHYLHGELDIFEWGIYLPGIQALFDGQVPYRDFFLLRGPLELYIPTSLMTIFGKNFSILSTYFYVGTVITLIICILLAKEIFRTRFLLYLFVPILVTKTFPRVVFHIWGGMRYGWGLLAILFFLYFLKKRRPLWMILAGGSAALAALTSIEIGFCAAMGIVCCPIFFFLLKKQTFAESLTAIQSFAIGFCIPVLPWIFYAFTHHGLLPYIETTLTVVTQMPQVFPDYLLDNHPQGWRQWLSSLIPAAADFKYFSPAWAYIFTFFYLALRYKKNRLTDNQLLVFPLWFYGLALFLSSLRKIGAAQFEMSLQPEKLLLFFLLEEIYLRLNKSANFPRTFKTYGVLIFTLTLIITTLSTAVLKLTKRSYPFRCLSHWLNNKNSDDAIPFPFYVPRDQAQTLGLPRVYGRIVPDWQAKELNELNAFLQKHTKDKEAVFMFPELGTYSFIFNRPQVGRFGNASFSWLSEKWFQELMQDLKTRSPRYAILAKKPAPTLNAYLKLERNQKKFGEMKGYILKNYHSILSTQNCDVFEKNG